MQAWRRDWMSDEAPSRWGHIGTHIHLTGAVDFVNRIERALFQRGAFVVRPTALIDEQSVGDIIALKLLHSQYPDEEAALAKKYGVADAQKWSEDQLSAYEAEVQTYLQAHRNDPEFQSALEQLEHEAEQTSFSIHADTLKWPHHAWVPRTKSDQAAVIAFVKAVNPQRIIFSVGPQDLPGQSVEEVQAFLRQAIPDGNFEFYTTRDDGSILLLSIVKEAFTFEAPSSRVAPM
jgi:hypothetical protein